MKNDLIIPKLDLTMFNLIIKNKAKKTLDNLQKYNQIDLQKIIKSLDELSKNWLNTVNIKNIWDWIFRKRVGRYRILFNFDVLNQINIWIIDLEKDWKKDYLRWKLYIKKS